MRKLFFALMLAPVFCFSQTQGKHKTAKSVISEDSVIRKWRSAVVNIYTELDSAGGWGTAIFLKYKERFYLLSAKHVFAAKDDSTADVFAYKTIVIENWESKFHSTPAGAHALLPIELQRFGMTPYVFSSRDTDLDLGIVCLSNLPKDYNPFNMILRYLQLKGYQPIEISDIDTICNLHPDARIVTVGFPGDFAYFDGHRTIMFPQWEHAELSLPVFTWGKVEDPLAGKYYFYGNVFFTYGNSGGPVVSQNKLVGIASRFGKTLRTLSGNPNAHYFERHMIFIKSSQILPLLRKLEQHLVAMENARFPKKRRIVPVFFSSEYGMDALRCSIWG